MNKYISHACTSAALAHILLGMGLTGCSGASSDPGETGSVQAVAPGSPAAPSGTNQLAQGSTITVGGLDYVPLPADYQRSPPSSTPIEQLSLDELAEAVTPILGRVNGPSRTMYRAATPNYALARAIKNGQTLNGGGSPSSLGIGPALGGTSGALRLDYLFKSSSPGTPQSTDYNTNDSPTAWPFSTVVFIQAFNGGNTSYCSGTYVGANTLTTAAHCVEINGTAYGNSMNFTPGATGVNGTPTSEPFGQFTGCYDWWYPSAWGTSCPGSGVTTGCEQYDWAAVDFRPCGNPTIAQTGYMGVAVNETSNFPSIRNDGYPGSYSLSGNPPVPVNGNARPGCGASNNPSSDFPWMCGATSPGSDISIPSGLGFVLASTANDTEGGMSGGPWWQSPAYGGCSNGTCEVAIHNGQWQFNGAYINFARRIDTTVWNFLTTYTEL